MLISERIPAVVGGADEVGGRFLRHLAAFTDARSPLPDPQHPTANHLLHVVKPAAGRNLLKEWTPGWGQRSRLQPACHSGHLHAGFKTAASVSSPPPRRRPPLAVFIFQLCPCVSLGGGGGSRLVLKVIGMFQPPLAVHPSLCNPPRPSPERQSVTLRPRTPSPSAASQRRDLRRLGAVKMLSPQFFTTSSLTYR